MISSSPSTHVTGVPTSTFKPREEASEQLCKRLCSNYKYARSLQEQPALQLGCARLAFLGPIVQETSEAGFSHDKRVASMPKICLQHDESLRFRKALVDSTSASSSKWASQNQTDCVDEYQDCFDAELHKVHKALPRSVPTCRAEWDLHARNEPYPKPIPTPPAFAWPLRVPGLKDPQASHGRCLRLGR